MNWTQCPQCGADLKKRQGKDGLHCPTHGAMTPSTCVACGKLYPTTLLDERNAVPWHNHKCDPTELPSEDDDARPIDTGKAFDDRLRDAELMDGLHSEEWADD